MLSASRCSPDGGLPGRFGVAVWSAAWCSSRREENFGLGADAGPADAGDATQEADAEGPGELSLGETNSLGGGPDRAVGGWYLPCPFFPGIRLSFQETSKNPGWKRIRFLKRTMVEKNGESTSRLPPNLGSLKKGPEQMGSFKKELETPVVIRLNGKIPDETGRTA